MSTRLKVDKMPDALAKKEVSRQPPQADNPEMWNTTTLKSRVEIIQMIILGSQKVLPNLVQNLFPSRRKI